MRHQLVRGVVAAAGLLLGRALLDRQRKRGAGVVLLYHRVAAGQDSAYQPLDPREFAAHCEFIVREFRVVRLEELLAQVQAGQSIAGSCAITFDDGYRDFLDHAYPVLKRFGLPATHFLVSDCLGGKPPWTYRVERLYFSGGITSRAAATHLLCSMRRSEREDWLSDREQSTPEMPPLPEMLRASDLGQMDPELVSWGSHTTSHGFLDRIPSDEVCSEIEESKKRIEAVVGRPVRYLAYPNGYYDTHVQSRLSGSGYEAAFAVGQAELRAGADLSAIPRIDVGAMPCGMLPLEVTGLTESIRKLLRAR